MPYNPDEVAALLPLPAAAFHILVALAQQDKHGYAVIQDVEERTGGALRLSPATLYRTIQRLLDQGLIVETSERPAPDMDDERRRYYRMTPFGGAVVRAELARMEALVRLARKQGLSPERL